MLENDLADRRMVFAQESHYVFWVRVFGKSGKSAQIAEQRSDLASVAFELVLGSGRGNQVSHLRCQEAPQPAIRPLGFRLALPRLAQDFHMPDGLSDRRLKISEVNRLCQKVERASVHRRTNIGPYRHRLKLQWSIPFVRSPEASAEATTHPSSAYLYQ